LLTVGLLCGGGALSLRVHMSKKRRVICTFTALHVSFAAGRGRPLLSSVTLAAAAGFAWQRLVSRGFIVPYHRLLVEAMLASLSLGGHFALGMRSRFSALSVIIV